MDEIEQWFATRVPAGWFTGPPEVAGDSDEILVVGALPDAPDPEERIAAFRRDSRAERVAIAGEAERLFRRKVSWGAVCGGTRVVFTSLSLPVMTRLRLPERTVLDTLVEAGVARSRSHALAWCVHLVGRHQGDWIRDLRAALEHVERVRKEGP